MRVITIHVKKTKSTKSPWMWVIRASNGQCYAQSECYTMKSSAVASVKNVVKAIALGQLRIEIDE